MKRISLIWAVAVLVFVVSGLSIVGAKDSEKAADRPIYRYVDRKGTVAFTDDLSRIPAEYRSSAKAVELPPAITLPAPLPPPKPKPPSFMTRLRQWIQGLSFEYRFIVVGVLPVLMVSLWVLSFLRKRSESAFVKLSLRLGMLAIVVLSVYVCYFIFIRVQAVKLIGALPGGNEIVSSPKQKAEELKKDEADRLNTIEDIANQK